MSETSSPSSTPTGALFTITRVFDAPRDLVFQAWSDPEALARWWGPKGMALQVRHLDFRPGGLFHYAMEAPSGHTMWGRFIYQEIAVPDRIVFINSFSDEAGGIARAPFSETWPLEILNTLLLTEQDGKTTLTLQGGPINATQDEQKTFEGHFKSMEQGFSGTMDQLAEYLAKAQGTL